MRSITSYRPMAIHHLSTQPGVFFVSAGTFNKTQKEHVRLRRSPSASGTGGENSPTGYCFRGRVLAFTRGESLSAPERKKPSRYESSHKDVYRSPLFHLKLYISIIG